MRRQIDAELTRRGCAYVRQSATQGKPFFQYMPLTQMYFPTIPHRDFIGRTGKAISPIPPGAPDDFRSV